MHTKFWVVKLKGRYDLEDLGVCNRITLKWISGISGLGVWIGFIWLRIWTGGRLL
jgi:hypothetical protein